MSELLLPWLVCVALVTVRLTVALALSPALSSFGLPAAVRIALTLSLAATMWSGREVPPAAATWLVEPIGLMLAVGAEVVLGALLGLAVHLVFAAFALAGRLLDVQIGFAIGSTFDPITRTRGDIVGGMMSLLALTLFFASEAHLELVRLLARSVDLFPVGQLPPLSNPMRSMLAAGLMYGLGLTLAAPVALALLLADITVGVLSRNMPQLNVLVIAAPVKVLLGFFVLGLSIRTWAPLVHDHFGRAARLIGVG